MIKNLLIRIANKIINKYSIHILDLNSIIQVRDMNFEIKSYNISKHFNDYTTLNLEAVDVLKRLDYKI